MKRIKIILFLICIVALAAVLSFSISAADKCTSYKIEDHVCHCGITGPWDGIEWSSAGEGYIMYEDECNDCFYTYYFYEWDDHVYDTIELDGKQYNYCVQCEDLQLIESGETDPIDPNPGDPDDPYEPDDPDPDNPNPDNPDSSGTGSTCIHTYKTSIVPPTCEERGYTWYECSKCGYAVQGDFKDPVPHEYESHGQKNPTCTTSGMIYYTCIYCGIPPITDFGYLAPLGHDWRIAGSVVGENHVSRVTSICSRCEVTKVEEIPTAAAQAQNWLLTSIRGASSGLIDMYNTVANGVEIGGVTVSEVAAGCMVLVIIFIFIGFCWKRGIK